MALAVKTGGEGAALAALAQRPGTTPVRGAGQGHMIRELRPFAEGDEPRHIDAAASARAGSPQVRRYHEDRERTVMLIADFRPAMLWGTRVRLRSVAAAEALCLEGWRAVQEGGAVGLAVISQGGSAVYRPRPRAGGMAKVTDALARAHEAALEEAATFAQGGDTAPPARPLAPELARIFGQCPHGAQMILASGFDDRGEGLDAALARGTARGPLHLLLIEDPFEVEAPPRALPYLDGEGRARSASFAQLPASRAARAEALRHPGLSLARIASDTGAAI